MALSDISDYPPSADIALALYATATTRHAVYPSVLFIDHTSMFHSAMQMGRHQTAVLPEDKVQEQRRGVLDLTKAARMEQYSHII